MRSRERGFTLVEAMIAVAIMAILVTVAQPSFSALIATQRVRGAASTLQAALNLARAEALKRNSNAVLAPVTTASWNSGWTVQGLSVDGTATATVLDTAAAINRITITGPASVTYNSAGRLASGSAAAAFKVSSTYTQEFRCLSVDLSGIPTVTSAGC